MEFKYFSKLEFFYNRLQNWLEAVRIIQRKYKMFLNVSYPKVI